MRPMSKTSSRSSSCRQRGVDEAGAGHVGDDERALEVLAAPPRPLRVGLEQPPVVRHRKLEHDERPHLRAVVERGAAVAEGGQPFRGQVAQWRRTGAGRADLVAELGVVGHATPGADVEHRLPPARVVGEGRALAREPPTTPLAEQDDEVDEGQSHAAHEHRLTGLEPREIEVGRVPRRQVGESGGCCGLEDAAFLRTRRLVEVALRENHEVGLDGLTGREVDALPHAALGGGAEGRALSCVGEGCGPCRVVVHGHPVGQPRGGPLPRPREVARLEHARGEGAGALQCSACRGGSGQARPLGQRGARVDGPLALHRLVGEDGDVLRLGVHPEQGRLRGAPDAATPWRLGVDHVQLDRLTSGLLPQPARETFDDAERARARADEGDRARRGHAAPQSS